MSETVLVCTYLEPEHVERIRSAWDGDVLYEPALLPRPRYQGDHGGEKPTLDEAGEQRWRELLGRAEIAFDFDWQAPADLPARAPGPALGPGDQRRHRRLRAAHRAGPHRA